MGQDPRGPQVFVVGAGIAGMIAALRLLEQNYRVTVLEASEDIGGKFGAVKGRHGIYHEHAYHIFPDWCLNFFALCEEIGLRQDTGFEPFPEFHILRPFPYSSLPSDRPKGRSLDDFLTLSYLGSPEFFWTNVNSRVADWQDMLLFSYSFLDLLTDTNIEREEFLNRVSVNGYIRSLGYASDMTALLHQDMLLKVFASPSYEVSVRTYQTYLDFTAGKPFPHPPFRAMKGNCQRQFWDKFKTKLDKYAAAGQYRLELLRTLVKVEMSGQNVRRLLFDDYLTGAYSIEVRPEDHVIFAMPPERLCEVARQSPELIKIAPHLLDIAQLRSVRFAALDLYFTEQLLLPKGHVTLMDDPAKLLAPQSQEAKNGIASEYGLSFIDNGQFWPPEDWKGGRDGRHFLGVLVGDFASISELDTTLHPDKLERQDNAPGRIIADLQKYIHFSKGDIDWERSFFRSQKDTPLFVNSVGSWEYRPETRLSKDDRMGRTFARPIEPPVNWYLAGDYCRSRIDVVSVEAALVTGVTAARAICEGVDPALEPPTADQEQVKQAKSLLAGWKEIAAEQARAKAAATREGSA